MSGHNPLQSRARQQAVLLVAAFILAGSAPLSAQLLPDQIGPNRLAAKSSAPTPDPKVWEELGLQESGQGTYEGSAGRYTLALYRLQDSTSALAAFAWLRPADAKGAVAPQVIQALQPTQGRIARITRLEANSPSETVIASGNYLTVWKGHKPTDEEMDRLLYTVPKYQEGRLPTLPAYLPTAGLHPNSERYIEGPDSLALFFPEIPPATAAFHLSAEGETAIYGKNGGVRLAVFAYPTPEIARKQLSEFEKIPGAMVKRSGPLLAVTINPADPNEAERALAQVRYQVEITMPEKPKSKKDDPFNLLWNIVLLIGILIVFCIISGLLFGGLRQILRRFVPSDDGEPMLSLHLSDRDSNG